MTEQNTKVKEQSRNGGDKLACLLQLCQQGDKQAFSELYQLTAARLNGIAYRITRHVDSANEVLQEAFIQVWQNCDSYNIDKSEVFTWLASIVRYRAYDRLRYDQRRHQKDMVQFNEMELTPQQLENINQYSAQVGLDKHSEQLLNNCLAKLEQKQSQSILMAYLYGYSREDIAHYFDTPINTIKSWIRRGLGRLQLCLNN
ncbi:MAG: sigma-70 family RNA polymerase sigma factor [Colwellia sp.]|nr:sigma-70 family RNA polymerase sigma factor [Colwellia sp.]